MARKKSERPSEFLVRFWGVRGSHAVPGRGTVKIGGNTSCIEVRAAGRIVVLDAGTGIVGLGKLLAAEEAARGEGGLELTLLISHAHHDHTQGFPFFRPLHDPRSTLHIYGPRYDGETMEDALTTALLSPYFPVQLESLAATVKIGNLEGGEIIAWGRGQDRPELRKRAPSTQNLPRVRVLRCRNHPGWGVLAFRVELAGRSLVYASDIEDSRGEDGKRLAAFCRDCDILVHDTQYLPAEYAGNGDGGRRGFGHSTFEMACELASRARARRLMLYHFSPDHDDRQVARVERAARRLFPGAEAAREGLIIDLTQEE
jgi:ribonuclease BN (tRNA processing enzyme)